MVGSILIVDDDEDTRSLLCEQLRRRGHDVEAVDSAKACIERLRTTAIDVV
jgi:CheY-like chemotaxis protein